MSFKEKNFQVLDILKGSSWPFAVFGDVENCANSMTALRRVADVRQG
jgi:hypothetical protein